MILTVDIGNSRIKWASWQAEEIVARGVLAYEKTKKADSFDELFSKVERPSRVVSVCVAGDDMSQALSAWVKQHWRLDVEYLKTEKQFKNIINAYPDPAQHGADRWAALVAAHQCYPDTSLCVISAGTAITFDLIKKNGQHLGGYILPSYATMRTALMADTVKVKSTANKYIDNNSLPDNTSDGVNQGLHLLLQAGIREICQLAKSKMEHPVQVILTGGFAKTILDYPDMSVMQYEPDLVMRGLYIIMKQRTELNGY